MIATLAFGLLHAAPGGPFDGERPLEPETRAALGGAERASGAQEDRSTDYKLLRAGQGLGRNPSQKLQTMLDAAIADVMKRLATWKPIQRKSPPPPATLGR